MGIDGTEYDLTNPDKTKDILPSCAAYRELPASRTILGPVGEVASADLVLGLSPKGLDQEYH